MYRLRESTPAKRVPAPEEQAHPGVFLLCLFAFYCWCCFFPTSQRAISPPLARRTQLHIAARDENLIVGTLYFYHATSKVHRTIWQWKWNDGNYDWQRRRRRCYAVCVFRLHIHAHRTYFFVLPCPVWSSVHSLCPAVPFLRRSIVVRKTCNCLQSALSITTYWPIIFVVVFRKLAHFFFRGEEGEGVFVFICFNQIGLI